MGKGDVPNQGTRSPRTCLHGGVFEPPFVRGEVGHPSHDQPASRMSLWPRAVSDSLLLRPHILQWVNLIWNFGDTRMRIAPPGLSISGNEFMRNAELLLRRAKSLGFFALERTFRF